LAAALIFAATGAWLLSHLSARDHEAERRTLAARAFELKMRAIAPGSPFACLENAGEAIQEFCEKALFASAETTAAAVSYVSAQIGLLADARKQAADPGYRQVLTNLRRAIEADRFGIAAHVLETNWGCAARQCDIFALLENSERIKLNLVAGRFEENVRAHAADWRAAASRPPAPSASASPPALPPTAAAKPPGNLFFPSSKSIPSVSIMAPEPPGQSQEASADAARARKPAPAPAQAASPQSVDNGPSAPLQITPPAQ
jgi:hypothetical protein